MYVWVCKFLNGLLLSFYLRCRILFFFLSIYLSNTININWILQQNVVICVFIKLYFIIPNRDKIFHIIYYKFSLLLAFNLLNYFELKRKKMKKTITAFCIETNFLYSLSLPLYPLSLSVILSHSISWSLERNSGTASLIGKYF